MLFISMNNEDSACTQKSIQLTTLNIIH
uniref:Uncharacterized protein n=1 Tax=Anguilla anguilla TaxID=7936 RepID=A0A0E9SW92_ANGAN